MDKNRKYSPLLRLKIAGMCLAIFVFYFTNIYLNVHYHVINGVTIVHSHICSDDHKQNPDDPDSHTGKELTLIQNISSYIVEAPADAVVVDLILTKTDFVFIIIDRYIGLDDKYSYISLRAPPVSLA